MKINEDRIKYWNDRYVDGGHSGNGSGGEELKFKIEQIWNYHPIGVSSILDIGCGDMRTGEKLIAMFPYARYIGLDVSSEIIERAKTLPFSKERVFFRKIDDLEFRDKADLVLCLDVVFHQLDDAQYDLLLKQLKESYNKYLILTEYSPAMIEHDSGKELKHRIFDPTKIGDKFTAIRIPYYTKEKILYIFEK